MEEGAPAKHRRISSVGVITDEVQKRLLERLSKGYLGAYLCNNNFCLPSCTCICTDFTLANSAV